MDEKAEDRASLKGTVQAARLAVEEKAEDRASWRGIVQSARLAVEEKQPRRKTNYFYSIN